MKTVTVTRNFSNEHQTLGVLVVDNFICKTLELGWHDNQNDISCIPKGTYHCKWTRSTRLSAKAGHDVFTYEVLNVPNRAGIRIHAANYFFQLLGCLACGDALKDINMDMELDVVHSGATVEKFNTLMNHEEFLLTIQ